MGDFLPQQRPQRVLNAAHLAEIVYTDRATGTVIWRASFRTADSIPVPPVDIPDCDYTVEMQWREDWRRR